MMLLINMYNYFFLTSYINYYSNKYKIHFKFFLIKFLKCDQDITVMLFPKSIFPFAKAIASRHSNNKGDSSIIKGD